ncbi:hypothetical protein [Hirschia baltica]|uniref:Uncharacterized protein n=1 Tax=Hirschia baltica (strain ATCC 49814 / DSM 5838 / IFAM 1418) TaxID=582402 RepID=C6XK15_HIRBI|nr:hypothetical protein [Hirschia baltica]ACT59460.1 hypothetical protein Hbal_1772 [Hirschia baltica ATCC 49814]
MTDKIEKPTKKYPKETREERLSAALRANLRRRKAVKKKKKSVQTDSPPTSENHEE